MQEPKTSQIDAMAELGGRAGLVNAALAGILAEKREIEPRLRRAFEYVLGSPGKRLRGALVTWCCEVVGGGVSEDAKAAAAAIEMVHTYSLIHDDLPAMDDDDLRRGRATCHRAFDEATAILAGDGLLTLAFEVLAQRVSEPRIAVRLIGELARAAGPEGMVAGQMADLLAEKTGGGKQLVNYIHTKKTAKMFRCAAASGAIAGGAEESQIKALSEYGLKVGLAFQIADDILDVSASSEALGKTPGKDAAQGKVTYPAVMGVEASQRAAEKLAAEAVDALQIFGPEGRLLRELAKALLKRGK